MAIPSRLANRTTGSTLFFTNLLLLNRSPPVVASTRYFVARSIQYIGAPPNYPGKETLKPFTTGGCYRSFNSSAVPSDEDYSDRYSDEEKERRSSRGIIHGNGAMVTSTFLDHPFLTQGSRVMCYSEDYSLETVVRVDMPGICQEGLNIQIENNAIHIQGKAEKEADYYDEEDEEPRIYSFVFDLPPGIYITDQIEASLKFGVLKIAIKKLNGVIVCGGIHVRATRLFERLN